MAEIVMSGRNTDDFFIMKAYDSYNKKLKKKFFI